METGRPKDLGFLKDFSGLEVAKLLEVQDKARLSALVDQYRHYTMGEIADVPFQNRAVQTALKPRTGTTALEIATGGGKTVIAAKIAKEFIASGGKVVYVCPNAAALGSEVSGIIQIFHRVFSHYGVLARIGQVNVPSKVNDVNFFTPMGLIGLRRTSVALFDQLLDLSTLILLDEAHHFPEDAEGILKVFGEIPKIAKDRFHDRGKKVVAFTATYGRLDGKTVVGKAPGFKFTIKNSVDEGRAPEVHGVQIYLPFRCPNAKTIASDIDLRLDGEDYVSYWRLIAGYMTEIWRRRPVPFAAFVRLRSEAAYLVQLFNKASGLEGNGLAVLTGDIPVPERERIINAVKDGSLIGYVTCGVGVESIDIPRLEVIHLIQRTKSINKIVQAVGRALRPWKGKPRALVVDYQVMKESVINGCNGILLYAQGAGVDPAKVKKRANGSAIVAIEGAPTVLMPDGATFGECERWVVRGLRGVLPKLKKPAAPQAEKLEIDPRVGRLAIDTMVLPYVTPPKDHWVFTGLYIEKSYRHLDKHAIQELAFSFIKTGRNLPDQFHRMNPDSYLVDGSSEVTADMFKRRYPDLSGNITVPMVWYLKELRDCISDFTNPERTSGSSGRRIYDGDFSWRVKFRKPRWRCLRTAFAYRDRAIFYILTGGRANYFGLCPGYGLTRFEILVKDKERSVLESVADMKFEELARELELFHLVDGEFPAYLNEDPDFLKLPSCEADIRYGDAEYASRREEDIYVGRRSFVEMIVDAVYASFLRKLRKREMSSAQWADLDEELQAVLCGERADLAEGLKPYKDEIYLATHIESARKEHRDRMASSDEFNIRRKDYRSGISRRNAIKLLWLSRSNVGFKNLIEHLEPGSSENDLLLLRKTFEMKRLEELSETDENLRRLMQAARAGEAPPDGLAVENSTCTLIRNGFEEFLYDERIDWLRKLENERSRHSGLAIQAAP
jgi:superfamily II DNA or RNA helicase